MTVGRKFGGANFFLSCLLNFRDDAARPWERARRVAGGTLKEVGEAADRALASWVDMIWRRLRAQPTIRGYSSQFSQRVDRLIWDVLEAELVEAADEVIRTDARVCFRFCESESVKRVFSPSVL